MSCDHCDKPAVVHEVHIRNGKMREVHLCVEHARAAGKLPGVADVQGPGGGIAGGIAGGIPGVTPVAGSEGADESTDAATAEALTAARKGRTMGRTGMICRCCGLAFHQLRQGGLLGCPDCYEQFGPTLAKIIERAQSGAVHHVGKTPRRRGGMIDLHAMRQRLVRELELAVAAEQYERAATLRDRILSLCDRDASSSESPSSPAQGGRLGPSGPSGTSRTGDPRASSDERGGASGTEGIAT